MTEPEWRSLVAQVSVLVRQRLASARRHRISSWNVDESLTGDRHGSWVLTWTQSDGTIRRVVTLAITPSDLNVEHYDIDVEGGIDSLNAFRRYAIASFSGPNEFLYHAADCLAEWAIIAMDYARNLSALTDEAVVTSPPLSSEELIVSGDYVSERNVLQSSGASELSSEGLVAKPAVYSHHDRIAFFENAFQPMANCGISIATHTFLYGTGVFEHIRGYWDSRRRRLNLFRPLEHFRRLRAGAAMLRSQLPIAVEDLCDLAAELCRQNGDEGDVFIRAQVYIPDEVIGPELIFRTAGFYMFSLPFGKHVGGGEGMHLGVSSWVRPTDNMIPSAKINGHYVNSSLARTEALENGFDESIMLNDQGLVVDGSMENVFIVREGRLITPSTSDDIFEGITRNTIIELARNELAVDVELRSVGRSEIYSADECFMCGTGAQLAPVTRVDHRLIGTGKVGELTIALTKLYTDVTRGRIPRYAGWLYPVKKPRRRAADMPSRSETPRPELENVAGDFPPAWLVRDLATLNI